MGWLDLEQPQPQFNPMGWLGGAGQSIEDPSVALARRMRQQSPNVPSAKYDMPIRDEYREGENAGVPSRGIFAAPAPKYEMPIQDEYRAGGAVSPGLSAGMPGRGVGSDYAASGGMGPAPVMPGRSGGMGSDYAASGGAGVPSVSPATVPTNGSGGGFWNDFGKGVRRVVPPWWLPENVPGYQGAPPSVPMGGQPGGVGSDYAAAQAAPGPGLAAPGPLAAPPPANVPLPQPKPAGFADDGGAQLPPNATSAVGALPPAPQPASQPSLLDRIGNGLNNNSELLLSLGAGFAGAPSFGAGMQRAFSNARPLMGRNQTVDALVKRGMPEEMARAAVGNPEVLKQVLPQFFGAKQRKFTQIGEDMMGNKRYGFVDEVSNKVYDLGGNEISHSQQGADIPTGPDGQPIAGEALRAHIAKSDPIAAAALKDMYEGKQNPNARNLQKLAPIASLVYPGFDATDYPNRLKLRNSYTSGADHKELEAINTVSGHMGKLMNSADALGNTGFKPWNKLSNFIADNTVGSPALVRFRNDLVTTQNELAKAYHGGHVSDSAFNAFNKAINEAQTPDELKASIGELAGLLHSKIATKENSYRVGMQHAPLPQEYSAMSDEAKNAFSKIHDWSVGNKPQGGLAPAAAPAAAPAPGKYILDRNNPKADPVTGLVRLP